MVLLDELQSERDYMQKQINSLQDRLGNKGIDKNTLKNVQDECDRKRQDLKLARVKADEFQTELNNFNDKIQGKQTLRNSLIEEINKVKTGKNIIIF